MREDVLTILRADVDPTSAEYNQTKKAFWKASADSTRTDNEGVIVAAKAQTEAMVAYTRALRRLNEFLLEGTIPEDLQNPKSGSTYTI